MNLRKALCLMLLPLMLLGCATEAKYQQQLNSWQGKKISDFISAWGYPDNTITAPDGNQVYVYNRQSIENFPTYTTGGYTSVTTNGNQTVVQQVPSMQMGGNVYYLNCTTWVEFDKSGTIVRTLFRGNNCVAN
jgi:hypothetical protein